MKKKLLMMLSIMVVLVCALAISVSAETTVYDDAPAKTVIQVSTNDIVVFDDGFSCPSAYICKDQTGLSLDFSWINTRAEKSYTVANVVELDIPQGTTFIGQYFFSKNTTLKKCSIPDSVTTIQQCIFQQATALEELVMEHDENDALTEFPNWTVWGCTALKAFSMPDCITAMSGVAQFNSCTNLKALYLSKNLESIGSSSGNTASFGNCPNLFFVNEPFTYDNIPTEKPDVYYFPSKLTSLPEGGEVFKNCKNLNNVFVFPSGVTEIANGWAFNGSNAITLVFLGDMTKISTTGAAWTKHTAIYFCNKNDLDSSCYEGASNIASTFVYCNAQGNETHLSSPKDAVLSDADCTTPESTTFKCFCGKEMGTEVTSPALGHTHEDAVAYVSINYNGNYLANGYYVYVCSRCSENYDDETADAPALFTLRGYSHTTGAIMQGFAINKEAFDEYVALTNKDVKYGILAANGALETLHVGSAFVNDVISVDFTNRAYDIMEMKIYGITSATQDTQLYCCGYVMVDGEIIYMDKNMADGELPAKVSYAGLGGTFAQAASLEAVVPTKEEVLA